MLLFPSFPGRETDIGRLSIFKKKYERLSTSLDYIDIISQSRNLNPQYVYTLHLIAILSL